MAFVFWSISQLVIQCSYTIPATHLGPILFWLFLVKVLDLHKIDSLRLERVNRRFIAIGWNRKQYIGTQIFDTSFVFKQGLDRFDTAGKRKYHSLRRRLIDSFMGRDLRSTATYGAPRPKEIYFTVPSGANRGLVSNTDDGKLSTGAWEAPMHLILRRISALHSVRRCLESPSPLHRIGNGSDPLNITFPCVSLVYTAS